MKISPPALVVYACGYDQVFDIIWRNRLRQCEPVASPLNGIWFEDDTDRFAFTLAFRGEVECEGNLAIIFSDQQDAVEKFIARMQMEARIQRHDLIGVWFWDTKDQSVMEAELGFEPRDS
jgi:hypothetical protein